MKGSFRLGSRRTDPMVAVVVEPFEESADQEVMDKLESLGAEGIQKLKDGYITANIRRSRIAQIDPIAMVTVKAVNRPL